MSINKLFSQAFVGLFFNSLLLLWVMWTELVGRLEDKGSCSYKVYSRAKTLRPSVAHFDTSNPSRALNEVIYAAHVNTRHS